jgi:hypothetical protein
MSERTLRTWGPKVQGYLEAGERLLETVSGVIAVKQNPGKAARGEPIVGTGAVTAARLGNDMPTRASGLLCVTDRRVLFFEAGFRTVKKMWWEIPRERIDGVEPGGIFGLRFDDGSVASFGGGHAWKPIGTALDLLP